MSETRIDTTRRRLLLAGAGLCGWSLSGCGGALRPQAPRMAQTPFTLGVASGEAGADGFVIWTRLAPWPLEDGGGMPPGLDTVEVQWEVAEDERFTRRVQRGSAVAEAAWAHSVHVELAGLRPARPYWYRFACGGHLSPAGRSLTAPADGAAMATLRLAVASCQHYETGYYAAYRHLAADDPALVLHLGDYIYEGSVREPLRRHADPAQAETLAQYRARYACYKLDADLQAAHAQCAWLVSWDDHEVDNDYAADQGADGRSPEAFLLRRAAAYQAFWEHQPLRRSARPRGAGARLYRQARYGSLLQLQLLDTRQYRSDQPCAAPGKLGGQVVADCAERLDPARTMLGAAQESWLSQCLSASSARWNLVAQQMLMARLDQQPGAGEGWWTDGWEGAPAARTRLLQQLAQVRNPVVVGGDIHSFWANDLKADFDDPSSATVASEFVGSSISSTGVPHERFAAMAAGHAHVRYFDSRYRGYLRCDLDERSWHTDLVALDDVRDPHSGAQRLARFAVEAGRPGVQRA